jgi:hypothetical protein
VNFRPFKLMMVMVVLLVDDEDVVGVAGDDR